MWSRLSTDGGRPARRTAAMLALLWLAGCAGGPRTAPDDAAADDAGGAREVPADALATYEQAVAMLAAGDPVEARLRFEAFILEYPDYPGAHVNLAIIHAARGDDDAAEASLNDALILDPDHAQALNQLGMLLRRQGRFQDAEAAYLRAIEARPDYALAHYNLAVLNELYLQRLEPALEHFERYQELSGEDEEVGKWITDLKRRLQASQRTANVTE